MIRSSLVAALLLALSGCSETSTKLPPLLVERGAEGDGGRAAGADLVWVPLDDADDGRRTALRGVVQGTVLQVDAPRGFLVLDSGGHVFLRARPERLLGLASGDAVEMPYRAFDGRLWVTTSADDASDDGDAPDEGRRAREPWAAEGSFGGPVTAVDVREGRVVVGSLAFQAHPETVVDLLPGQVVRLSFADVGGALWVKELRVARGAPS